MSVLEGHFARYLENNRQRINSRFSVLCGNIPPEFAYTVLREIIAPIVQKIPQEDLPKVADVLIDNAFVLLRKGLIGPRSRSQAINLLWNTGFPSIIKHITSEPKKIVGSFSNAVFRLEQVSQTMAQAWIEHIVSLSHICTDVDTVLKVGQVLAWIKGLSEYRKSAIQIWFTLNKEIQIAILGTEHAQFDLPWLHPESSSNTKKHLVQVGRIGGFVDFGGAFVDPPMLLVDNNNIIAFDSARYFTLHADFFGMQLRPYTEEPKIEQHTLPSFLQIQNDSIIWGTEKLTFPCANATSAVYFDDTLAITIPHSHYVFLFARVAK